MTQGSEHNLPILESGGKEKTSVGNYFVSNYPAYSFWTKDQCPRVDHVLDQGVSDETPLGLYIHIPFCRKRCDFCYFKVYTDKNAGQIRRYLDAVIEEIRQLATRPYLRGRPLDFVYFGGGTPSYLSADEIETMEAEMLLAPQDEELELLEDLGEPAPLGGEGALFEVKQQGRVTMTDRHDAEPGGRDGGL